MGGELRIERLRIGQQIAHAGEIRDVGVQLAREHGIVGKAALLRPFDLAVPIRALDEADGNTRGRSAETACAASAAPGWRACRKPARQCRGRASCRDAESRKISPKALQRDVEPVLLLGVDGEGDALGARSPRQRQQARIEFAHKPRFLARLEARMQRGELHGDGGARENCIEIGFGERACRAADGIDGFHVALIVALRVTLGARGLAQHVEGEAEALGFEGAGAQQGALNSRAEHELIAEQLDGLTHGLTDHRLAGARDQPLDRLHRVGALCASRIFMRRPVSIRPQVEALTNMLSECAAMLVPGAARDLVGDERVGGRRVGNAQQRLREAHQDDALVARQPVLVHERIDARVLAFGRPGGMNEVARDLARAAALVLGENGALDQRADETLFVDQMMRGNLVARREGSALPGLLAFYGRYHSISAIWPGRLGPRSGRLRTIRIL